jgi:serine/threonine protein kinase/Tol biopolymer transport system component
MSLPGGTRIGVYEIVAPLGAGGMGEVYRARDTRLERHVALKILLDSFAGDPERRGRFEREAKLLASLNHPHIAQIYGLEDGPGIGPGQVEMRALVMELVEGPTLADRLEQGNVPLDEALSIARQIAAALEAAHEQGIIHRDLKPSNIKLRPDGTVKVLDFGLAKLADPAPGSIVASAFTSPGMTRAGLILGTPAYMSPEQARGQAVDARTDLWALGCVCYEMLAGRRAFDGDTASDAIAAVLTREPDWSVLPATTPAPLRRLIARCLARDATRRLRHAGDVRIELDEIASGSSVDDRPAPVRRRISALSALPWALALVATAIAGWFAWGARSPAAAPATSAAGTARVELGLPPGLELFPSNASTIVASPDGQAVAFIGTSGGERHLFLRRLGVFDASPLRGTLGATTATFSPDGQSMAFVTSGGELKIVSLPDGLVTTLTRTASLLYGVAWAANDQIIFVRAGALWTVPRSGGDASQLTTLASDEQTHAWPSALPGEPTVLFTVETTAGPRIDAIVLGGGERRVVLDQASRAKIGPEGRLFFYRDERMLATGFDASTTRAMGSPIPVLDTVPDLGSGMPVGDVTPTGLMVFPAGSPARRLVWVSRQGVEEPVTEPARAYLNPRLSPDNQRIVVQVGAIWVHDLRRGAVERLPTLGAAANAFPAWLPDGTTVMYRSGTGLRVQSTLSSVPGRTLPGTTEFDYPSGLTPDGKTMVFNRNSPETSFDVMFAPIDDASRATALVQTTAYEGGASLSSDGRWLVYVSNESGRNEVYVRPLERADRRWQVSSDGGSQPVWNPNGTEIFYRIGDRMMAVAVTAAGNDLRLSAPRQLFVRPYAYGAGITIANFDVTKDGQRFLMVRDDTSLARLRVILNWRAEAAPIPAQ